MGGTASSVHELLNGAVETELAVPVRSRDGFRRPKPSRSRSTAW